MLKVLHVGKFFSPFRGGVENYMRDAMVSLNHQGVRSFAVVHHHDLSFRSVDDIIEVGYAPFHVIRAGTWFRFLYTPFSPMFPVLMRRLAKRYRPDLVHLHMPNPSAFWVLLMGRMRRIPWVVHWHADVVASTHDPRLRWFYHFYRPLEQAMLRRAAAVIVTSQAYLDFSEPLKRHRHKCHVVPLGLDPAHRTADEAELPLDPAYAADERFKVLAIGRLTYYKGFRYLIEAAGLVKKNIRIDIVGTGDQRASLQALVGRLGLDNQVTLRGHLNDAQLHDLLQSCDVVCLPSIERTEAFGMVLLEAMLHGKAILVSDVPGSGMGWIVEHGHTGLKVPPADSHGLAKALAWLRDHPDEVLDMGRQGRERFERDFAIDQSARGLIEVYENIVQAGDAGQAAES
jgi:rhamnosyl/mannosyltransferase